MMFDRQPLQPALKPGPRLQPEWSPRYPLGAIVIRRQGTKFFKVGDHSQRINGHASSPEKVNPEKIRLYPNLSCNFRQNTHVSLAGNH
jgi:hypothetical protein